MEWCGVHNIINAAFPYVQVTQVKSQITLSTLDRHLFCKSQTASLVVFANGKLLQNLLNSAVFTSSSFYVNTTRIVVIPLNRPLHQTVELDQLEAHPLFSEPIVQLSGKVSSVKFEWLVQDLPAFNQRVPLKPSSCLDKACFSCWERSNRKKLLH